MSLCPFCGAEAEGATCAACGRDVSAPRRPCPACKAFTPVAEPLCSHCGVKIGSEMPRKVIIIVTMFVVAFAASIAVRMLVR